MKLPNIFKRLLSKTIIYNAGRRRYARGTEISETEAADAIRAWQGGYLDSMFAIYNKMLTGDPHITSTTNTRTLSVVNAAFSFTTDDPEKDEDLIRFLDQHLKPRIPVFAGQLVSAYLTGAFIGDIKWSLNDAWIIDKLIEAPPGAFKWDEKTREFKREVRDGHNTHFEELDPLQTAVFAPRLIDGLPYGVLQSCINYFMFKDFAANNWASYTEVFGMPLRQGKYQPGASQADIDNLWNAVYSMGNDSAAVISENTSIEILEKKSGKEGADIYHGLIELANMEISKAVLGQTSTTETIEKGNYYTAKNHAAVRDDYRVADLRMIEAFINQQIIAPMMKFNFGIEDVTKLPRLVYNIENILDGLRLAQTAKIWFEMGKPIHPVDAKRSGLTVEDDEESLVKSEGLKDLL